MLSATLVALDAVGVAAFSESEQNMTNDKTEELEARAAAFLLMSSILRKMPEHEWVNVLAKAEVFREIPFAQGNAFVRKGSEMLCSWADGYTEAEVDGIYSDCMHLLIGPGKPAAPPWESVYSEDSQGLIFQQETLDVRRAYSRFGLQIDQLHHEPDDHLAYEMEFVSRLCARAAELLDSGRESEAVEVESATISFLRDHLLNWGYQWCDLVDEHASTDFYRGLSLLIRGFLQESEALCAL